MARGVARKGQGKGRKAKAKRTGPSQRTAAERAAIDWRAAKASAQAKREQRARQKAARAKPKTKPLAAALAPLVAETAGHQGKKSAAAKPELHRSQGVPTIAIDKIIIGKRHRKDFSHVPGIVQSINDRGGLIQPISLRPDRNLIAGECRIMAWQQSKYVGQPIPYHVLDVDSIIAGERDENATRKDFTLPEAVSLKRDLEKEFDRLQRDRERTSKPAPGRKASGEAAGRIADRVGQITGVKRETMRKAEAVVDAAASAPKRHGDLLDEMARSGKANAAYKKLQIREAKAAIVAAPPALPMNAKQCATWLIDFPWAGELDADQAKLDAAGRAFRPYPEMSIKTICAYAREQIMAHLPDDVALWLCVTNFVLVRGYHLHVYGALGFKPEAAATMLTWGKDRIGRGQILRDQTEHAILLTRGKVTIDVFGKDPPSTLLSAARGENSVKPRALYELIARVTPAKRYAEIFSTGAHGLPDWDCHGDQVGKYAKGQEPAADAADANRQARCDGSFAALDQDTRDARLLEILDAVETEPDYRLPEAVDQWFSGELAPLVAGKRKLKLTAAGRTRRGALLVAFRLKWLERVEAGNGPQLAELAREYLSGLKLITGMQAKKLTALGRDRLAELREERDDTAAMALLPDDIGALVALYGETIARHHAAVLANDQPAAEREERRLELLIRRANGGTLFGSATDDSPAERLRAENRAAIGAVPMWGQEGIFRIAVDGMAAIVHYKPIGDWFDFHAEDGARPFISETGYQSETGGGEASLGCTVQQQAENYLREEIATPLNAGGSRREARAKKNALPLPEKWFRIPASWADCDDGPPAAGGKDLFGKPVIAKPAEPQQVDLEDAIAQFENADLYRIPDEVIDAIGRLGGHIIARSIDHDQGEKGHAVATCQCGWSARADRTSPYSGENVLAPQEEAHWRAVLDAAAEGRGSGEDIKEQLASDDPGPIPPELRRRSAAPSARPGD